MSLPNQDPQLVIGNSPPYDSGPGAREEEHPTTAPTSLDEAREFQRCLADLRKRGQIPLRPAHVARREDITDPGEILDVLQSLMRSGCPTVLWAHEQAPIRVEALPCEGAPDRLYFRPLVRPPARRCYVLEIQGFNSIFQAHVGEPRSEDGGAISIALPACLTRIRRRAQRRVAAPGLRVRFVHPRWPEIRVERPLRDISHNGLSFYTVPSQDLVYQGLRVEPIELLVPGGPPLSLPAEVHSLQYDADVDGDACGMRVIFPTAEAERRWTRIVAGFLHPRTRTGSEWTDAAWELYEVSGYFHLSGKTPQRFLRMRAACAEVHRLLDEHPRVGYRVVRPSPRGAEGSASALKVYQGTWLGHQLAKRSGPSLDGASAKEVLREVILGTYEPMLDDPDFRWLLAYCEASVRWVQGAYTDFARAHEATALACVLPFRLLEGSTRDMVASQGSGEGFWTGAPTPRERRQLLSVIARTRPLSYREALDLVTERFDLAQIGLAWRRAGLARERQVMVARHAGQPVAAAILERATRGTNLFHLLDGVRLFCLKPSLGPALREAVFAHLLRQAARWYGEHGNESFVYYMEHDDPTHAAGMTDLGEGRIWLLARELMPDWLEHIFRLTSPPPAVAEAAGLAERHGGVGGM
ncbi:MAG TPA: PilZ domain-containing protein [Polyangia bacterium]|jgi:hypothetical protein|nr:PilZ domain-containing protein [Polyangia bacterium]